MDNLNNTFVTLSELLSLAPFAEFEIIGGWSGKNSIIRHVIQGKPGAEHLENKNFLSVIELNDLSLDDLRNYLDLAPAGIILHDNALSPLDSEVRELAKKYEIPVIRVINNLSSEQLVDEVNYYRDLVSNLKENNKFLKFAKDTIYIKLKEKEQFEVVDYVNTLIGNPLIVLNDHFKIYSHTEQSEQNNFAIVDLIYKAEKNNWRNIKAKNIFMHDRTISIEENQCLNYLINPLYKDNYLYGFVIALEINNTLTELDKIYIQEAGNVILQQLINNKNLQEIEKKYKKDFIHDLLFNNFDSEDEIIKRGKLWGFNLTVPHHLFLIEVNETNSKLMEKILLTIEKTITSYNSLPIIDEKQEQIVVLIPENCSQDRQLGKKDIIKLADLLLQTLKTNYPHINFSIGIGKKYDSLSDLCRSYQEAKNALELGKFIYDGKHVTHFEDLGIMNLLANVNFELLEGYYKEYLSKILEYDKEYNSNLLDTLTMYFKLNGDINLVAEKLFVHPNSLRYRLKKIEELTELDLRKYEDALNLCIACKVKKLCNK